MKQGITMLVTDPEYKNHSVFGELDGHIAFYEQLAYSVSHWASLGTSSLFNMDSYVFSSIQGTLASIRAILRDGRINDAYALLRKYYDSVTINIYSILYLDEHRSIDNFAVEQIDKWVKGETPLPKYRIMSSYIRCSPKVALITGLLFTVGDDRYKRLRDRCNDHTHFNFYKNVLLNDPQIYDSDRGKVLDEFAVDARDVLILHFAYMFFAEERYMMSSDYLDCLECGMPPEADSEYWVAPFIQDVFDKTVTRYRPDIAAAIKGHTNMRLE